MNKLIKAVFSLRYAAVLVSITDWEAVNSEIERFDGEELAVELTPS